MSNFYNFGKIAIATMSQYQSALLQVIALLLLICSCPVAASKKKESKPAKKADPNDNKGNTPFFLQDPYDQMCLGPSGFTVCDERALWILTRVSGKKTYALVSLLNPAATQHCLERKSGFLGLFPSEKVGMGSCKNGGSRSWEFEFVDQTHVKLSSKGQCLVRGKRGYKNSASVQSCKKKEFLPLVYHPTAVHENGFYLKSADGSCFDGSSFRACEGAGSKSLFWGVGIKYIWGQANRYFFNFNPSERNLCIVHSGGKVAKQECTKGGAYQWGLRDGQLSANNGKICVARLADNTAVMAKCSEASEYVTMEVPTVYTAEDLQEMLKNQDKLSPEEKQKLAQLVKQYELSR